MHARYVALAVDAVDVSSRTAGPPLLPPAALLQAWAAAEGAVALRAVEAAAYDDSSLAPAEEVRVLMCVCTRVLLYVYIFNAFSRGVQPLVPLGSQFYCRS